MKRILITISLMAAFAVSARSGGLFDNLSYYARFGYNLGGTAPIGMPATIRSLDKYTLKGNFTIALDAYKPLAENDGRFSYREQGHED